jgi:hypothetical protein
MEIMMMGDMNAKIGSNNKGLEHVMGQHVIGAMESSLLICLPVMI